MEPPVIKAFVHIKPNCHKTWGFHANKARHMGPAMRHYQCYTVMIKDTAAKQIMDTVKFQHCAVRLLQNRETEQVV
eukprot:1217077-Ditylum_brightwellii.AAC.1